MSRPAEVLIRESNMIKLAAFDIDGTLFDERRKEFPHSAVEALGRLGERGILVAAATGRPPRSAEKLWEAGIHPDYFVCSNGHLILDRGGTVLWEEGFPPDLAQAVWDYCRPRGISLLWKYTDATYVYHGDPEFDLIFAKSKKNVLGVRCDDTAIHLTRAPNGGCLACSTEELERFNGAFAGRCRAVDINGRSSDLLLWGVDKQTGLARLLREIGVRPEEVIAFGDNLNDMELLRFAGIGVAMGNGDEDLKAAADYITQAVDQDGIYLALQHFQLL